MGVKKYVVCDACEQSEAPHSEIKGGATLKSEYTTIIETGNAAFDEVSGWVVKLKQDPDDAVGHKYEYYCPQCVSDEMIEDSGDRKV